MSSNIRPTRAQQREEARAKAKAMREQHKKAERRKGLLLKAAVGLAVVGAAAIIASVVIGGMAGNVNSNQSDTPRNLTSNNGFLVGANGELFTSSNTPTAAPLPGATAAPTSPVKIITYVDYQCPYCAYFENANIDQIKGWLDTGLATLEVRPLSFLDGRGSPNEYSSRAANATACVASFSPNNYFDFSKALFINQPLEGNRGPSNNQLFNTAKQVGVTNESEVETCIKEKSFGKWILKTTDATFEAGVPEFGPTFWAEKNGTPAVFVNGQHYKGAIDNPAQFAQFVMGIASGN
jgi:protein-disulfide isomerase